MRKLITLILFCPVMVLAQKPFINSISPTHVEVGETVTITGSNLTNVNRVFFGGVSVSGGSVSVISDNLVEATVPAGATNGSVIVQTTNDLIAESSQHFYISFSGSGATSWKTEFLESLAPESDVYDLCLCDLNNDGLNDVVMTHNGNSGVEATIFENQSTFDTESFVERTFTNNPDNLTGFISTTCADLDNDGNQDVIFTTNDGTNIKHIYIYENTSAGTVSLTNVSGLTLLLPDDGNGDNRVPRRVKASDIDGDGLLDLVVGNENDNTIHIFPNTSSGDGNFTFDTEVEITVGSATSTGALDIGDFDNDGKPDIVIIPASKSNELIYVLRNQSIPDNINFSIQATVGSADQRRNVVIGDFDDDGLNDFAVTADRTISSTSGVETVEVFRNTTSGTTITFTSADLITIPSNLPWGIDAGDLNGDGLIDLAVACVGGNIYTINNTTSGSLSFGTPTELTTGVDARNVRIGDLDIDARPDLAYSHDVSLSSVGDLGIRLNKTCIEPVITPDNLEFCNNDAFTLNATKSLGTYTWEVIAGTGADPVDTDSDAEFIITSGASATVRVTLTLGGCAEQSTADFTLIGGAQPSPPTFGADDLICAGDDYTITASGGPFAEYIWTRPDGSETTTSVGTLDITNATINDGGSYTVRAKPASGCYSEKSAAFVLEVSQAPLLEIINNNLDDFCTGTSVSLEVPDFTGDFTYEWQLDGADFGAGNVSSISTNQEGNYTVEVTDVNTCLTETATYAINSVALPTSVANGPSETCVDFQTSFTSASSGEGAFTLQYEWVVEDATDAVIHTATTQDLDFTFPSTGNYEVILNTNYDPTEVYAGPNPGDICVSSDPIAVTVSAAPSITFDQTDLTAKCQAESLTVGLSSPNSATIQSYAWTIRNAQNDTIISTATTNSLDVTTPIGVDTVWVAVDITTTIGCQVKDSIRIRNFPSDLDISSTDFTSILEFDSALLEEATSINLSADNAVSDISWGPDPEQFSNPADANTIFFPQNPTSTVTLTATDNNGCAVSTEVRIVLDNIRPKRTFSPNGDNMNDCWEILNIGDLGESAGCKVYVFDSRGRKISTKEDFIAGDNCVWDGNFNNSPVPEGVYYFVMKCEDSNFSKSGSILLAR
ncbi:FG-GAP-like repeat-containing protein [Ekhidna sp.]|jgi:gliding motility-associated-like protein|uniref:FG-GAP-like repeat-containing protein n=1 Tax=Ekhidna sp. TaxID=2608089 RepID=UPI0032EBE19F